MNTTHALNGAIGTRFEGRALIKEVKDGTTRTLTSYRTLTLTDLTDTVDMPIWNITDEQKTQLVPGVVIAFTGEMTVFAGKKQLTVTAGVPIELTDDDPHRYMKRAGKTPEAMRAELGGLIDSITDPFIRDVVRDVTDAFGDALYRHVAAKRLHHEYPGGLVEHTLSMARVAESFVTLYPVLDRDLLLAGVILHDLGKMEEYTGGFENDVTVAGRLLGHIHIMQATLHAATAPRIEAAPPEGRALLAEKATVLQHLVLSHHGRPEWGSATRPQLIEAEVLHHIDNLDARLYVAEKALRNTQPGTFGEKLFAFENRALYRPSFIGGAGTGVDA